jgi:prepilin-type processing-associated H-X9-DG protein/prepilin-type N-terminal cleavage/methylation domain-containing protein
MYARADIGFSLLELLTVIAIIAVLAALLFPVFAAVREKGRAAACISNEKQLALAMMSYTQDYDERFPSGILPPGVTSFWAGEGWAGQCRAYLSSPAVLVCPDDTTKSEDPNGYVVSYGYNLNLVQGGGFYELPTSRGRPIEALTAPQKTVLLFEVSGVYANVEDGMEGAEAGGWPSDYFSPSANGLDNRLYAYKWAATGPDNQYATGLIGGRPPSPPSQFHSAKGRHSGGSDYLFADGHVKWLRGEDVSSGLNAPTPNCNQDNTPALNGCATGHGELHAAGTGAIGTPFDATFSVR